MGELLPFLRYISGHWCGACALQFTAFKLATGRGAAETAMTTLLVNIDVPDLARAEAFYTTGLGFRVGRRLGKGALELLGAGVPVYLLEKPPGSKATPGRDERRDYGRHWTPLHLDVVVPVLDEPVLERLRSLGAKTEGEPVETAWGRMQWMADPFGHGLCLLEFRGRGYDALVDP